MGLDIAAGILVALGAIRGWFRGFLMQAIRLGGLVGAVYLAGPIRDQVRPHVAPHLATIRADLLDRMLWWASGILCYFVVVGLAGLLVNFRRNSSFGDPEASRGDQAAGFLLGAIKSAVVAAFLVAALDRYAGEWMKSVRWAEEQARDSAVLAWERQYRPADRIWAAPPVQQFVAHVRKMGLAAPEAPALTAGQLLDAALPARPDPAPPAAASAEAPPRNPRLGLPPIGDRLPRADAIEAEVREKIGQPMGPPSPR